MSRRVAFPSRFAPRGVEHPITGKLSSVPITDEQRAVMDRIVVGLFLDLQDKPLADILLSCYVTGMQHGIAATQEQGKESES